LCSWRAGALGVDLIPCGGEGLIQRYKASGRAAITYFDGSIFDDPFRVGAAGAIICSAQRLCCASEPYAWMPLENRADRRHSRGGAMDAEQEYGKERPEEERGSVDVQPPIDRAPHEFGGGSHAEGLHHFYRRPETPANFTRQPQLD
jgi:hypothetical protein